MPSLKVNKVEFLAFNGIFVCYWCTNKLTDILVLILVFVKELVVKMKKIPQNQLFKGQLL